MTLGVSPVVAADPSGCPPLGLLKHCDVQDCGVKVGSLAIFSGVGSLNFFLRSLELGEKNLRSLELGEKNLKSLELGENNLRSLGTIF